MTVIRADGYEVVIIEGGTPLDPDRDNVDVIVKFDGGVHHAAVFATFQSVRERLAYYRTSGECASGLYFWTSHLILVERLTTDVIATTVADLIQTGAFQSAFSPPSYDIQPQEE